MDFSADGTVLTRFATTPLISPYNIAYAVTDFRFRENAAHSELPMRVFAAPEDYERTNFPLVEGEKLMKALTNYLQVPYPLPKMDQMFLPNWGGGEDYFFRGCSKNLATNITAILPFSPGELGLDYLFRLNAELQ